MIVIEDTSVCSSASSATASVDVAGSVLVRLTVSDLVYFKALLLVLMIHHITTVVVMGERTGANTFHSMPETNSPSARSRTRFDLV